MEFEPESLSHAARYNLLIGAIVPRPIAVVGTMNSQGQHNLAPFSFFNAASSDPMGLLFCPANRADGGEKDSLRNAKPLAEGGTGCFSISVATESTICQVVACAEELPHGESEFDLAHLTPGACTRIRAPFLRESPIHFECETISVTRFALDKPHAGNIVMGRVVHVRVDDALANERMSIDPAKLAAVGRLGGRHYTLTRERIDIPMGRAALTSSVSLLSRCDERTQP